jgi:arylsulfatase A-like enzyme
MDTEIGRLLDNLPKEERENTIIVFIGDNGTPAQVTQTPFVKGKSK